MRTSTKAALVAAGLVWIGVSGAADAQGTVPAGADNKIASYVPEDEIQKVDEGKKQGLDGTLGVAANINMTSNRRVVGQVDGFSLLFGVSLLAGLDYVDGPHEVRNTLSLNESWAKTPVLSEFVKANDVLDLESVYNFFILSWFGPFARLNLQATVLQTEDVRAESVTYLLTKNNGIQQTLQNRERLVLGDPFSPLTLNESAGLFAEPYDSRQLSVSLRLGSEPVRPSPTACWC